MKHDEEFLLLVRKVEKLLIKAEDGKWTGSEYIVVFPPQTERSELFCRHKAEKAWGWGEDDWALG